MCSAWHRSVGTTVHLDLSLCVVTAMHKISLVLSHSAPYSQFEISHFRLQTNMGQQYNFWKLLPNLCILLSVTASASHLVIASSLYAVLFFCQ